MNNEVPIVFDEFIGEPQEVPQTHSIAREEHPMTSPTLDEAERAEPDAWMHVQGNHQEPSLRRLDDDEKARGWTEYPLYRAALSVPQESGWQPIDTAPKDDKCDPIILGFAPDEENYSPESREGFWSPSHKRWMLWSDPDWTSSPQPTHWRPLPPPPGETEVSAPQLAGDAVDARRYRFLRDDCPTILLCDLFGMEAGRNPDEELDAAIDSAIQQQEGK